MPNPNSFKVILGAHSHHIWILGRQQSNLCPPPSCLCSLKGKQPRQHHSIDGQKQACPEGLGAVNQLPAAVPANPTQRARLHRLRLGKEPAVLPTGAACTQIHAGATIPPNTTRKTSCPVTQGHLLKMPNCLQRMRRQSSMKKHFQE